MNILIVDDNDTNRRLLKQMLSHLGFNHVEADSGQSAVEIIKHHIIDIILMDIMMPHMDGYEATRIIKDIAGDNHIPIIFVTALKGEEALGKSLECGGDDYICKPVTIDILGSKIRAHGRIRELTQQLLTKNKELVSHNQRLQYEHELISYFFDNALKRSYLDERCIHYHFSPMAAFNGDLMLSRRSANGGLYLLLGDFTGHGLTAAMGTLPVAQCFFDLTKQGLSIGDIARNINTCLKELLPEELFFAATIVEINANGNQLEIWNGGMPDSIVFSEKEKTYQTISSKHMPLGILGEDEFEANTVQYSLDKGDRLILYTDGIVETRNERNEEFGDNRLHTLLSESGDCLFNLLRKNLADFSDGTDQQDDISIVEILCDQLPDISNVVTEEALRKRPLPWHFSTTIDSTIIRNSNPVSDIVETLDAAINLGSHKGLIYTILSEAYNNAVNHSILGLECSKGTDDTDFFQYYEQREQALSKLSNAYIKCSIEYASDNNIGELLICLQDNGTGSSSFPSEYGTENLRSENPDSLHGRGLHILSELCEKVNVDNQNNLIELTYVLN